MGKEILIKLPSGDVDYDGDIEDDVEYQEIIDELDLITQTYYW